MLEFVRYLSAILFFQEVYALLRHISCTVLSIFNLFTMRPSLLFLESRIGLRCWELIDVSPGLNAKGSCFGLEEGFTFTPAAATRFLALKLN